jgi:membrane-bound inhibitor of C-type lysozyme
MRDQRLTRSDGIDLASSRSMALWTRTGEGTMRRGSAIAGLVAGGLVFAAPAAAQTFYNYRCADGSELAVGFFDGDTRAHIQLDGKTLALPKRLSLAGTRYSLRGIQLRMTKDATTLKDGRQPWTTCTARKDW